jgi:hypothetical protein
MLKTFLPPALSSPAAQLSADPMNPFGPSESLLLRLLKVATALDYHEPSVYLFVLEHVSSSPFLGSPAHVAALRYLAHCLRDPKTATNARYVLAKRVRPVLFPPPRFCVVRAAAAARALAPNALTFCAAVELAGAVVNEDHVREDICEWVTIGWAARAEGGFYGSVCYRGLLLQLARIAGRDAGGEEWRRWFDAFADRRKRTPDTKMAPGEVEGWRGMLERWWEAWVDRFVDGDWGEVAERLAPEVVHEEVLRVQRLKKEGEPKDDSEFPEEAFDDLGDV